MSRSCCFYCGRRGNMRKRPETVRPLTNPPKNASDSANFRPRHFHGLSDACSMTVGENSESAALGVEGVLRKFRYALSNRTRGRFSAFSPCQRKVTGLALENGAAKNAYNRTHSFCGFDGWVLDWLDLLKFQQISVSSVVKK